MTKRNTPPEIAITKNFDIRAFQEDLLRWWDTNKRQFPWRSTTDPYEILIAEVLLHRTRAEQVVPIYSAFLKKFPSITNLASATYDDIKSTLKSVGLFWRIELLYKAAKDIVLNFEEQIPDDRQALESLPGISHYIASAIRCFAYGYPEILLDTNTVRVTGRLFSLPITDRSRRSKLFQHVLDALLDREHPREFNFALIDLGALICRSQSPLHGECPVLRHCDYGRKSIEALA